MVRKAALAHPASPGDGKKPGTPRSGASLRLKLWGLVALVMGAAVMMVVVLGGRQLEQARGITHSLLRSLHDQISHDYALKAESAEMLLLGLAQSPVLERRDPAACQALLRRVEGRTDGYSTFVLLDAEGRAVCASSPVEAGLDLSHRDYFQQVRDTGRFAVGGYIRGAVTGTPVLAMGHPVRDADGALVGVLATGLTLDWLDGYFDGLTLPRGVAVTTLDGDGRVLSHHPGDGLAVGQTYPDTEGLAELRRTAADGETVVTRRGDSLYVFGPWSRGGLGLDLLLSVPHDFTPPDARVNLAWSVALLVGVMGAAGVITWVVAGRVILRPVQGVVDAARRIGRGEAGVRCGPPYPGDELGVLARQFDRMTDRLERNQEVLERRTEALARSNEELESFAYVASHDLQEPLRKVRAFGDLLEDELGDGLSEDAKLYLKTMQSASERMSRLIQDLLLYSRVTTRGGSFERTDLNAVVRRVIDDLEMRLEETGGRVEVGPLPEIDADPVQMQQLFQNLLGNALKFHRSDVPPHIEVTADSSSRDDALCRIEVKDNGIGFDTKYAEKIFETFQRLHGREAYEGTGMGLTICRRIAGRHGGTIAAQSEAGAGSRFIITLPRRHGDDEEGTQ